MAEDPDFREPHLRHGDFLGVFAVMESERGILMVQNRRVIAGSPALTWDLPGGQVEPGEELHAALHRELEEEIGVAPDVDPAFLFVQEGTRTAAGARSFVWRSFFFRVGSWTGQPAAGSEVLDCRFVTRGELPSLCSAPYHDSFLAWLRRGGTFFLSSWED